MENKEWLTLIDNIISEWTGEYYYFDAIGKYADIYPKRSSIIDIFPNPILDKEKYYQVSVFYKKWVDGDIDKRTFLKNESKYLDFIRTLWLYNTVDVCYNLYFNNYFRKGTKKLYKKIKCSSKKDVLYDVQNWNMIKELLTLALREAGFLGLYFKQWEILAVINDFSIQLLFKDEMTIQVIRPLVEHNFLYVHSIKS